eukprot:g7225.t1
MDDEFDEGRGEDSDSGEEEDSEPASTGAAFSDANSKWLKLKSGARSGPADLMEDDSSEADDDAGDAWDEVDDDDDDDDDDDEDDDDHDDDDEEEEEGGELEIERQSRLLAEEERLESQEAAEEMEMQMADGAQLELPGGEFGGEGEAGGADGVDDPQATRRRINDVLAVLADFKARRAPNKGRADYMAQLQHDFHEYFGYLPELVSLFCKIFSPREALEFFEANEQPRPTVIRTNTLKTRREDLMATLTERGMALEPLAPWSKVGVKIVRSTVPVGATPEYLAGHYMLQAASSMCAVTALKPMQKERILDMASAPGGKSSYISQMMRNTGVLVANDIKRSRLKSTAANLARLGVQNCLVCNYDGRRFPEVMGNFDRVLLDAPCTGLGVIARDPSIKVQKTLKDVQRMSHLQKELILAAIDSVDARSKTGGVLVYSTCSVAVEENEEVVQYALARRQVKLIPTGIEHATPGFVRFQHRRFHPSMKLTSRLYPHVHNMDGFYVAKFKKYANGTKQPVGEDADEDEVVGEEAEEAMQAARSRREAKPARARSALQAPKRGLPKKVAVWRQKEFNERRKGGDGGDGGGGSRDAPAPAAPMAATPPEAPVVPAPSGKKRRKKTTVAGGGEKKKVKKVKVKAAEKQAERGAGEDDAPSEPSKPAKKLKRKVKAVTEKAGAAATAGTEPETKPKKAKKAAKKQKVKVDDGDVQDGVQDASAKTKKVGKKKRKTKTTEKTTTKTASKAAAKTT